MLSCVRKRIAECRVEGIKDEEFVMNLTKDLFGGEVTRATRTEDMTMHIDFWWDSPKKGRIGIDVKGIRKDDGVPNDKMTWLEFRAVNGKKGWLYGEEEYIAFITYSQVVYVRRETLATYAEKKIEGKETVFKRPSEYYIPYSRKRYGRDDLTIRVPMEDLIELASGRDENGRANGFFAVFKKEEADS